MSTSTSEIPSGSQKLNDERSLNNMPNEILFVLFECFAPKDIVRCRQVCTRWRDIIDTILHNDTKWEQFCKHDFPKSYEGAMWKSPDIETWSEMYRTLSLWSSLDKAHESVEMFCHSRTINEEIQRVTIQKKGLILVHKKCRVAYFNLLSKSVAERKGIPGQFDSLVELEDVVVILERHGDLRIANKLHQDWHSDLDIVGHQNETVFNDVKSFLVQNRTVFFIKFNYQMYLFHLDNKTLTLITLQENTEECPDPMAVGFKNGCLYILTMDKELYSYDKGPLNLICQLDVSSNLMDCLYQHNMLDNLDWRHYYHMLSKLQQKTLTSILNFIVKMHVYGELFFVCTSHGVLEIYNKPFVNGELNLMQFKPIKIIGIPLLSVYPITNIQVVETKEEGHIVLVCMARTIQAITFGNKSKTPKSTGIVPYVPQYVL